MNKQFDEERYTKRRALYMDAVLKEAAKHDENTILARLHPFDGAPITDAYVLIADWNKDELQPLENIVSSWESTYQVKTAFDDEIYFCDSCGLALYARPSFYGADLSWTMIPDGYTILCRSCFTESELDGYIDQTEKAIPHWALDVARGAGFIRLADEFKTGFHRGQNDDPAAELKKLTEKAPNNEYIPYIIGAGQFDVTWGFIARAKEK